MMQNSPEDSSTLSPSGQPVDISVVVPCYNEEACLQETLDRLVKVCEATGRSYEIILVDDGSTDTTWPLIEQLSSSNRHLVGLALSRNYGHQLALTAGLQAARGERIMMIDADLQDPPELLPQMLEEIDKGADVVYGKRKFRDGETFFKKATASVFYHLISKMSDTDIPRDVGDFRMVTRDVLDHFLLMRERSRFIRGMFSWVGYKQVAIEYDRDPRFAGTTKYTLRKMVRFAVDAITSFSTSPLRLAAIGAFVAALTAMVSILFVFIAFLSGKTVSGWASTFIAISFFSAVQLLSLAVIGEYVGRLFIEMKGRPLFIVRKQVGRSD